eukprot:scaffold13478_cov132-Cylindrotheca_fusiformis.AAC.43
MMKRSWRNLSIARPSLFFCAFTLALISHAQCFNARILATSRPSVMLRKATSNRIVVAVTREDGKNEKLLEKVESEAEVKDLIELLELPCIEHASGPDRDRLEPTLASKKWDYVIVTSPEAANVLASAWDVVRDDPVPVVAVGVATEKVLRGHSIDVCFTPSKANAVTLSSELEMKGPGTSILYPASARARETLQKGLEERGFEVTRLNTYDTVTAAWSDDQKEAAKQVKVACFASPSSVKGWLYNTNDNKDVIAACIGETSANACRGHDWDESKVFFPEKPGLDEWVQTIKEAVNGLKVSQL